MIKVKLFGIAKEIAGERTLVINETLETTEELLKYLRSEYPDFIKLKSLLIAINDEYAFPESRINPDDEIAIIPPVSGG
ncbi:MAG: MoaD/ThiS family protein [Bacteroidota bacterium]